jgi:hypothetical protein
VKVVTINDSIKSVGPHPETQPSTLMPPAWAPMGAHGGIVSDRINPAYRGAPTAGSSFHYDRHGWTRYQANIVQPQADTF